MSAMHASESGKADILGKLKQRGLLLVTDLIFANLGVKSLLCLASTCTIYRQLFQVQLHQSSPSNSNYRRAEMPGEE